MTESARTPKRYDALKVGGALYVIAVFQFFIFELVAETLYPGYSVANNYISDLGGTCANAPSTASCIVNQPSATIFDTTLFLMGLLLLIGTFFVYYGTRRKPYFIVTAVADIGTLLVGVFPEPTGWIHADISVVVFLFMGISLILAWTIVKQGVFRYLAVAFGVLTLYFDSHGVSAVGVGGSERLLVLSILCGILALGGYLTGRDSSPVVVESQSRAPLGKGIAKRKLLLIGTVLVAVGVGLILFGPSTHTTNGALPPGCSKQSNGEVTCSGAAGNSSATPQVGNGGGPNSVITVETIAGVTLIGLGLILVAIEVRSDSAVPQQAKVRSFRSGSSPNFMDA